MFKTSYSKGRSMCFRINYISLIHVSDIYISDVISDLIKNKDRVIVKVLTINRSNNSSKVSLISLKDIDV